MANPIPDFGDGSTKKERISDKYVSKTNFKDRVKNYLPKRDGKFLSSDLSDAENIKLFRQMKILKRTDKKDFQEKLDRLNYVRKAEGKKSIPTELFDIGISGRFLQKKYEAGTEEEKFDKKNKEAVFPEVKPKRKSGMGNTEAHMSFRNFLDKEINNVPEEKLSSKIKRNFSNALKGDDEEIEEEPELKIGDIANYEYNKDVIFIVKIEDKISNDRYHVRAIGTRDPKWAGKLISARRNDLKKIANETMKDKMSFVVGDVVRYIYRHVHTGEKIIDADYSVIKVEKKEGHVIYTLALMTNKYSIIRVEDGKGMSFLRHENPQKPEFKVGDYVIYSDGSIREKAKILNIYGKGSKFAISIIDGGKIMNDVQYRYIYPIRDGE
jgi:hypothetical protein